MEDAKILVTEEELKTLRDIQNDFNLIALQLGNTDIQIKDLENIKLQLFTKLEESKQKQQQLGSQLNQKYGVGTIDLESGEFVKTS